MHGGERNERFIAGDGAGAGHRRSIPYREPLTPFLLRSVFALLPLPGRASHAAPPLRASQASAGYDRRLVDTRRPAWTWPEISYIYIGPAGALRGLLSNIIALASLHITNSLHAPQS